ncbi:MAG TPA: ATP-binding protein [candidate division Zixibacteria bacterium]|nr:ATP-binding protein [candidate division Zixibacteria bacterium]
MIERFTYPSTLEAERELVQVLTERLEAAGVDDTTTRRFLLIVSEVFTNAVIHGNKSDANRKIEVRFAINEERITADIIDQGHGGLERIQRRPQADSMSEGGRGIDIVCHCASNVEFAEAEHGGLIVSVSLDISEKMKEICE